jgi:FlaA1/EpsC-like NDP-sugar epimerase
MKILITGASGSIGKEIVKQLIENNEIICFDRNEEKIFYLEKELLEKYPNCKLTVCLGSITDVDRVKQVFDIHKPNIVYHTAANKHVPLGEENIHEFVYNNIQGTINLSDVALSYGAKLVFISTDKAVEPSSVMGYTKRMCEKYLLSLNKDIVICRFGNIIGSSGSVYEIFEKQAKEGIITVTHPDMERYFISVENAVTNLIACSLFKAGVYVFNMGEPVKIMEVAKKFSLNIKIIGLRKGEKIKEKLYYDFESKVFTENQNIFNINTVVDKKDKEDISLLVENSLGMNKEQILNQFKQINNERNS